MPVVLTSHVEGLAPGETYTGPNESFYLENGYAKRAGYTPDLDHPTGVAFDHGEELPEEPHEATGTADAELKPPAKETYVPHETVPEVPDVPLGEGPGFTEDSDASVFTPAPETLKGDEDLEPEPEPEPEPDPEV